MKVSIMDNIKIFSDHDHELVVRTAAALSEGRDEAHQVFESLFHFVRDRIIFGFPTIWAEWDRVTASRVIQCGFGYCNTKATLLVALCRATGIPARVHYGKISIDIMRGIFPSFAFPFLPDSGPHSWTEVEIDGEWKPVDSYINDEELFRASRSRLEQSGRSIGYSVACVDGKCSCELNFGEKGFVQMGAVVEDHGPWDDASQYYATEKYVTFNAVQRLFYPVVAKLSNAKIAKLRASIRSAA
jgi:hypothetical protein